MTTQERNTSTKDVSDHNTKPQSVMITTPASFVSIIAPSIAFFGCQFSWAVQDGNVTPYLRELGMSQDTLNYAWLLGPITGLIFQPIVAVFSDHCTSKLGRRRPFIIFGSFILSICLLIFCNSESFSFLFNPLIIAFLTFWQLDFSTNLLEGPLRAITSDTLNHKQQLLSHSWFGIMNGCASIIGFALGYFIGNIQIIFAIAAIVMIASVIITSILVKETPISLETNSETDNVIGNVKQQTMSEILKTRLTQLVIGCSNMPYIVKQCWYIQFCSYFGHFACWVFLCDYFGSQIMNGNANKQSDTYMLYKLGVEYGNLSFMFISIISVIFSFCITKLTNIFGIKLLWIGCLMVYALVMICSLFIYNLYIALFIFSFIGIPMAGSFTIPWSIIGVYSNKYDKERACLWAVILNIAECGPELMIALFSGLIIELFKGKVAGVLIVAGFVNLFGVYLIFNTDLSEYNTLNENNKNKKEIEENNNNNSDEIKVLLRDDDHILTTNN